MKSKKMIASTALLLIVMLVAFCFIGCENPMNNDTPGGGVNNFGVKSGNKTLPFLSKEEIKALYDSTNPAQLEEIVFIRQ